MIKPSYPAQLSELDVDRMFNVVDIICCIERVRTHSSVHFAKLSLLPVYIKNIITLVALETSGNQPHNNITNIYKHKPNTSGVRIAGMSAPTEIS